MPALPATADDLVRSDVPTLMLSGGRDPVTPPGQAASAAAGLSRQYSYTFPTMGHGVAWQNWNDPFPAAIARQFLADPARTPDPSCIAATPALTFLTDADIHPTPAIYRLDAEAIGPRDPGLLVVVGAALAGLVAGLGYAVAAAFGRLRRRASGRPARGPRWGGAAAGAASVLGLGYAAALAAVVLRTDRLILGFGVPGGVRWPLVAASGLGMAATLALAGLVVRAWVRRTGTPGRRVLLTAVAAASVLWWAWLAARGLLFW